jgi:hypothetical protein
MRAIAGAIVVFDGVTAYVAGTKSSAPWDSVPLEWGGSACTVIGFLMIVMDYISGGRSNR